jgi:hypothetical protein
VNTRVSRAWIVNQIKCEVRVRLGLRPSLEGGREIYKSQTQRKHQIQNPKFEFWFLDFLGGFVFGFGIAHTINHSTLNLKRLILK